MSFGNMEVILVTRAVVKMQRPNGSLPGFTTDREARALRRE